MTPWKNVRLLDLSEIIHENNVGTGSSHQFRNYSKKGESELSQRVRNCYYQMHTRQTVDFVRKQHEKWLKFDHAEMTIMEALHLLNNVTDESDPDTQVPNIVHAFQTAERIRSCHPSNEWLQVTGLIHDLGKILALFDEPHWAVCGDTYPVGCAPSDKIVFGFESFHDNPDMKDGYYSTQYGMYLPKCGLSQLLMSWGHDEYLYRVLKNNECCKLPGKALHIVRFHSFYPWHSDGQYDYLMEENDKDTLSWVKLFNQFDLYSKIEEEPRLDELVHYYEKLIDKYCPGKYKF